MLDDSGRGDLPLQQGVIREDYWVEVAGQDSDETGENDRVHVEIARPQSAKQLPVVVEASPYYGEFNEVAPNPVEVDLWAPDDDDVADADHQEDVEPIEISADDLTEFTGQRDRAAIGPSPYEEIFLEQGYVWAYAASIGTEQSTGCLDTGGERERNGVAAVIDWFNGRATAYESETGSTTAEADWTNGRTGMIGASYNGTLPNAMAARGIDGLETIVPVVAISSWYDYYRMNGHTMAPGSESALSFGGDADWLQRSVLSDLEACAHVTDELIEGQDRTTGDYNDFWRERDYVTDADNVDASVLIASGLYDYNVWLRNASRWLDALKENDVPYKVWFHQGEHQDPLEMIHADEWTDLLTDWFGHWLKDEDTGVMDGPTARVQRQSTAGPLETDEDWPAPDAERATVEFTDGGETSGGIQLKAPASNVTESFVDKSQVDLQAPATWDESVFNFVEAESSEYRLCYRTGPLEQGVRLSGTPQASLRLAVEDDNAAIVSVALVDYAPAGTTQVLNFGRMNPHNRESLEESLPIEPGEFYDLTFPMQPVDHVFEPGHRIGVVVYSSDIHFTKRPPTNPELTLSVDESSFDLPVVGGRQTLELALPADSYLSDQWDADLGSRTRLGTPAADDQRVYATDPDGAVVALSRGDGTTDWTADLPVPPSETTTPFATGETVYVGSNAGLYAFDTNGQQQWAYSLPDDSQITTTPEAAGGTVFVATSGGSVHAIDTTTADSNWTATIETPVYGTLAVGDDSVYAAGLDGTVVALDATTGEHRWEYDTQSALGASSPVVTDETVYVPGDDLYGLDASTGDEQFRIEAYGGTADSTPTVVGDMLYVGGIDETLYAVDTGEQAVAWTAETTDSVTAKPAVAAGVVIAPSTDGRIHLLDAKTGAGFGTTSLSGETKASPEQTDDGVYLSARDGTLTAFTAFAGDSQ
jgi:X-Pro dipeptidyl-peptidase